MTRLYQSLIISFAVSVLGLAMPDNVEAKGPPIKVELAVPNVGEQGLPIKGLLIKGRNLPRDAMVIFIYNNPDNPDDPQNGNKVQVKQAGTAELLENGDLILDVDVVDGAFLGNYDIEVQELGSDRKGKGTTLFKVESSGGVGNECNFDFEATFEDAGTDGVVSDGGGSYVAWGGAGMRLDTNGSIKLERRNDTRFIYIDFRAAEVCTNWGDPDPDNEEIHEFDPAGFCHKEKGVDLRLEHQVEEPDICSIQQGTPREMVIKVTFEADPGNTLLNGGQVPKRNGATTLSLNYGCVAARVDPLHEREHYLGVVTRLNPSTWTFEGKYACLHTNLGDVYKVGGVTQYLEMPFKFTIVDVDAPAP